MPDNLGTAGGRASSPVKQDTVGGVPKNNGNDSAPRGVPSGRTIEDFTGKGIRGSNPGAH